MKKVTAVLATAMISVGSLSAVSSTAFASTTTTATTTTTTSTAGIMNPAVENKADAIIQTGVNLIGKAVYSYTNYQVDTYPYQMGCGGFAYYVFKQNGIDLGTRDITIQAQLGEYVPKDQLQKGDLVFFDDTPGTGAPITHVAVYMGDNKIVHMADTRSNVIVSDLDSSSYYRNYYKTARRIIPSYLPSAVPTPQDKLIEFADSLMGKAKFGNYDEANLTFNSTGYAYYVYKMNGIDLKTKTISEMAQLGDFVTRDQLQKGDLVFFSNGVSGDKPAMVGIYAGNYQFYILSDANGVKKYLTLQTFYNDHYVTARRVMNQAEPTPTQPVAPTVTGEDIANMAQSLLGKVAYGPYNETALTFQTGADFTYYVFKKNGIDLGNRTAINQAQFGKTVSKDQLQNGDLVFFSSDDSGKNISTAGVYIGNGQFVIYSGKALGLNTAKLTFSYYQKNYVTAKRLF